MVVAVSPPNGSVELVAARTGSLDGGIFRSEDDGDTVGPIVGSRLRPPQPTRAPHGGLPSGDGFALIEDPTQPGRVY